MYARGSLGVFKHVRGIFVMRDLPEASHWVINKQEHGDDPQTICGVKEKFVHLRQDVLEKDNASMLIVITLIINFRL